MGLRHSVGFHEVYGLDPELLAMVRAIRCRRKVDCIVACTHRPRSITAALSRDVRFRSPVPCAPSYCACPRSLRRTRPRLQRATGPSVRRLSLPSASTPRKDSLRHVCASALRCAWRFHLSRNTSTTRLPVHVPMPARSLSTTLPCNIIPPIESGACAMQCDGQRE